MSFQLGGCRRITHLYVHAIPLLAPQPTWLSVNRQRQEYKVFQHLLKMVPHLTEHLMESPEEKCMMIADFVGVPLSFASSFENSNRHSKREVKALFQSGYTGHGHTS